MLDRDHGRPAATERCLRWPDVQPLVGVSRTTWWRLIKAGTAPAPIKLAANCVGWPEGRIRDYQEARGFHSEAA